MKKKSPAAVKSLLKKSSSKPSLSVVILGAGRGTRMKSAIPKVLHKIAGRAMINLVIDAAKELDLANLTIVISTDMQEIIPQLMIEHSKLNINFAIQKDRKGTADALKTGLKAIKKLSDILLVLYADTPLLKIETLRQMVDMIRSDKKSVSVLGFDCFSENKYGRLIADKNELQKIVEFKDATAAQKKITLCNSGVVAVDGKKIEELLAKVTNNNASGEFYLTDIVAIAKAKKLQCGYIKVDENEVMGVNSRLDLSKAEAVKQNELRQKFMENGVTLIDPNSVYFAANTKIANDVIIHPQVFFGADVEIESGVEIKSFSHIEGAVIKSGCAIGPFARIRPGTMIDENAKIGNFVEIKKSFIKKGAKISHLSYIGDSEIGEEANIGAGVITCNYDGYNKFKTKIGKNVFIGSNSALIAPLEIGDNAVIGAGSVITKNVAKDDLALSRAKQTDLKNGGKNYHKRKK